MYAEDPSFRDAKIVYALHDDDFDQPLDKRMAEKLRQEGFPEETVADIDNKPVDYLDLTRLALAHSDAVVQCTPEVKPEVLELVKASGLPFLPYQDGEDYVEAYGKFYESL